MSEISKSETIYHDNREITLLRIANLSGAYIEITNLGASVISIIVPDKEKRLNNVALRYDTLKSYLTDKFYLGATIGRYANRISDGIFSINKTTYHLDKNDGNNSNHGGFQGFSNKIFNYSIQQNKVIFFTESYDGEGGFPGHLHLWVSYSFSDNNELLVEYKTISDRTSPINLTNHTYFNLSSKGSILNHKLKINAVEYIESDNQFLPTGNIKNVKNTAFDFLGYKHIAEISKLKNEILKGYNTYFIKKTGDYIASLKEESSGRVMDVYTSMPGIMVYTGDYLSDPFSPFKGICLEAHYYPDAVNHENFISNILVPDIPKYDFIKFHFYT